MIPDNVRQLMQRLLDRGYEAFIVGGAVRDTLVKEIPKDYDIFTNCKDLKEIFPEGNIIGSPERQEKILTIIVDGVEISRYRGSGDRTDFGNTLLEHCSTCDLTINAMAMDINGVFIDFFEGKDHVNYPDLYFVGDPNLRIKEDPLRILRVIRFAAKYNCDQIYEDVTNNAVITHFELLKTLPIERIREEFLKIIQYKDGVKILKYYKFFNMFIPMFSKLEELEGGHYHMENVSEHSLLAFDNALKYTDNQLIHLACLFHDIGKAVEFKYINNKITFYGHQHSGSDIVKDIMTGMRFSDKDTKYVSTMIRHHMMGPVLDRPTKSIVKIVNELEDAGITVEDMVIMTYCDNQANLARNRIKFNEFYQGNPWLRTVYKLKFERLPFRKKDMEINGNDVIALGETDGPKIGLILEQIYNEILEAQIKNDRPTLLYRLREIMKK